MPSLVLFSLSLLSLVVVFDVFPFSVIEGAGSGFGFRPGRGRCSSCSVEVKTAGRQLFQCCNSNRGSPETVVPTFIRMQFSPILSVIGKGPSYCAPSGGGFPFLTSTCVTSDMSGKLIFSLLRTEVCMA